MRIEAMEKLLEGIFVVPGTNFRVGLDVLLDIIPVGGSDGRCGDGQLDGVGSPQSGDAQEALIIRMAGNIGFDALAGCHSVHRGRARSLLPLQHAEPEDHQGVARYKHHPSTVP
jgi:hypothetical protein